MIRAAALAALMSVVTGTAPQADQTGYTRANVAVVEMVWDVSVDRFLPDNAVAFKPDGDFRADHTLSEVPGEDCAFLYAKDGQPVFRLDLTGLQPVTSRLHTGGRDVHRIFGHGIYCVLDAAGATVCQDSLDLQDVSGSRRGEWRRKNALDFLVRRCGGASPAVTAR